MPVGTGGNSYFLFGQQPSQGTRCEWENFKDTIYQFNSGGLGLTGEYTNVQANKGNLAPSPTILSQVGTDGSVRIPHDATKMGFWLQQMLYDSSVDSVQIAATALALLPETAAVITNGTAVEIAATNANQPRIQLPKQTNAVPGLNAAKIGIQVKGASMTVPAGGASFTVKGFDQGLKRPLEEVVSVVRGSNSVTTAGAIPNDTIFTTANRFATVTSITPADFTGTLVKILAQIDASEYYRHTLSVGNALLTGLSAEMVKGTVPNFYQDVHVSEATYTVGALNEISMTLLGGEGLVGYNAENGGSSPSSLTGKSRPAGLSAPGWATIFRLGDIPLRTGEGSVTVNHNLGQDENPNAREVYRPAPVQTGVRSVQLSTRTGYPAQIIGGGEMSAQDLTSYAWGRDVKVSIDCALMDFGAAHNSMTITLPTSRMSIFPDQNDIPQGQINQPFTFDGYALGGTSDLQVVVVNNETGAQFVS